MIWTQQFLQYLVRGQVMNPVEADVEAFLVACEQKRPLRFRDQAQRAASMFLREVVGRRPEEFAETSRLRICRYFKKQDGNKCCPNLNAHSVGAGAYKGLDFEVLLKGLEKEFDLPARLVDSGNRAGG